MRLTPVFGLLCLAAFSGRAAAEDPLAHLKTSHPRLILTDEALSRLRARTKEDPLREELEAKIIETATDILSAPRIRYVPAGGDMLDQSRAAVQHILTCAMAYRLTGNPLFAARAQGDLATVIAFPDWNPSHFLDVAEMSFAVSIGYDWLYPQLSSELRTAIKKALMEKALSFCPAAYTPGGSKDPRLWWSTATTNWNEVCNCGLLSAALAIAEDEPALARAVIADVRSSLPFGLASYNPDGAFPEGPGYWAFGTTYAVIGMSELESALGTDFELDRAPGFSRTAVYRHSVQSPTGQTFNYSDSTDTVQTTPAYAWLAGRFGQEIELADARSLVTKAVKQKSVTNRFFALHAIWFPEAPAPDTTILAEGLDVHFRGGADIAIFRSAWSDPNALFVGFKAGANTGRHAHLDLGSFVLDADGERWAADLGPDNYELPGYFDYAQQRWGYFRVNNHSHNTVTPGDALQSVRATAPITGYGSSPAMAYAIADLTSVYPAEVKSLKRGVAVLNRSRLLVQDEFEAVKPGEVLHWSMATGAKIALSSDGRTATLTENGKTLSAEIMAPSDGHFSVRGARPPTEAEDKNQGMSLLQIDAPCDPSLKLRLDVLFSPVGERWPQSAQTQLGPLADWN